MDDKQRILVVDDEPQITRVLRRGLTTHGYEVRVAADGESALQTVGDWPPDLVVTDLSMPSMDGLELCRNVRAFSQVPIIVLSVRGEEKTKVQALDAGADDYVTKPFGVEELLARSEALLRRRRINGDEPHRYSDGMVEVDFDAAEARVDGRPLSLSPLEFRLLGTFVRSPNRVLSQDRLLQTVWGDPELSRDRVKIYVGYLRSKFRDAGVEDAPIETVRGFGYRYRPPR